MKKKFMLSTTDKWIGGVCGGLSEYIGVDPLLIRIMFLVLMFGTYFPIGVVYCLTWILAPTDN